MPIQTPVTEPLSPSITSDVSLPRAEGDSCASVSRKKNGSGHSTTPMFLKATFFASPSIAGSEMTSHSQQQNQKLQPADADSASVEVKVAPDVVGQDSFWAKTRNTLDVSFGI